jgi:hypothetical protein
MNIIQCGTCDFCRRLRVVAQGPLEHGSGSRVWPQICRVCLDDVQDAFVKRSRKLAREHAKAVKKIREQHARKARR